MAVSGTHGVSVAVCSVLVAGGLVAAVGSGSPVHEPGTEMMKTLKTKPVRLSGPFTLHRIRSFKFRLMSSEDWRK